MEGSAMRRLFWGFQAIFDEGSTPMNVSAQNEPLARAARGFHERCVLDCAHGVDVWNLVSPLVDFVVLTEKIEALPA